MSGSLTRGDRKNVPGIPGACATHNFAYLVRDPRYYRDCMKRKTHWDAPYLMTSKSTPQQQHLNTCNYLTGPVQHKIYLPVGPKDIFYIFNTYYLSLFSSLSLLLSLVVVSSSLLLNIIILITIIIIIIIIFVIIIIVINCSMANSNITLTL